jgi:hypothetical protein
LVGSYAVLDENLSPLVELNMDTAALLNLWPKLLTPKSNIKKTENTALIMVAKANAVYKESTRLGLGVDTGTARVSFLSS